MRNVYLQNSAEPRAIAAMAVTVLYLDYYKKDIEVLRVSRDDDIPWDEIDGDVRIYLVGYTPGLAAFRRLVEQAGDVVWIDNDMDAVRAIEEASDEAHPFRKLKAFRGGEEALCELTWRSYFAWARNPPLIIGLLGRYEMGDEDHPDWESRIVPFNRAFDIKEHDPLDKKTFEEFWEVIMCLRRDEELERETIDAIIEKGKAM